MRIRIVASGEVLHVARDLTTKTFLANGMWEEVQDPPVPPAKATWVMFDPDRDGVGRDSKIAISASCATCGTKMFFAPKPNKAAVDACGIWHCGRKEGVPEELASDYIRRGGGQPFPVFTSIGGDAPGAGFLKKL